MKTASWLPHVLSATALTATVALCLVGCGDENPDAPTAGISASASADGSLHPGTFRANLPGGASVRITLPAPGVPDGTLDTLRRQAKVSRATYATVEIDNRRGASPVSVSRLILRAEDGASYQLEHVSRAVEKWKPRVRDGEYRARDGSPLTAEAARDLKQRLQNAGAAATKDVPVGERDTNLLVGDISQVPDSFVSLELIPQIGDREVTPVRAHPESRNGSSDTPGASGSSWEDGGAEADDAPAPDSTELPEDPRGAGDHKDPVPSSDPTAPDPPVAPVDPVDPVDPVVPVDPNPLDPHPVDPDPAVPDPEVTQPVVPDPVDPGAIDPGTPAPVVTDPAGAEPVVGGPVVGEPGATAPAVTDSALPEAVASEPAVIEAEQPAPAETGALQAVAVELEPSTANSPVRPGVASTGPEIPGTDS